MSTPAGPRAFAWGFRQQRAARLVADDCASDREIAQLCSIGLATLTRWKAAPDFAARVERIRGMWAAAEVEKGIASREKRISGQDQRHQALLRVVEERAADATMRAVPGGTTGLVLRTYKQLGLGKGARLVEEYAVDAGTLRELRELEKHVACELGQWTEKHEHTGEVLIRQYPGVGPDDV